MEKHRLLKNNILPKLVSNLHKNFEVHIQRREYLIIGGAVTRLFFDLKIIKYQMHRPKRLLKTNVKVLERKVPEALGSLFYGGAALYG